MDKVYLQELIDQIKQDRSTNVLSVFFVKKPSPLKMYSYLPQISTGIQNEIIDLVLPYIENQLKDSILVDYNPVGVADGEIEYIAADQIEQICTFFNSITNDVLITEMDLLEIPKISFYCLKISYGEKDIYLFRQFSKMKKLRSGLIARFLNNELTKIDSEFLGIDEAVDMIYIDRNVIIFNHIALERIFNYRDRYLSKTNEAMGEILSQDVIVNLEQFQNDCCRDVRIMKRFTNLMTQKRLPLFFENYDKVPEIVKDLDLRIEFDDGGKMIYHDKSQLYHIVALMSDSYFESLLAKRKGIAKLEEPLS